MNHLAHHAVTPADVLRTLRRHRKLIVYPAVAGLMLAAAYALVAPRNWRATQALIVRAEAAGLPADRLGKFSDLSEMKTLQETILELAKSQSVITATLERVGRPRRHLSASAWPTITDVDEFRDRIKITPPGGAEFGKTEVFYLSVLDTKRSRGKQLVAALCDVLEHRMQELRDDRAGSMIAELENGVELANGDLQAELTKLSAMETEIGSDLSELRALVSDVGGTSEVSQQLRDIETEVRQNAAERRASRKLIALLKAAQANPKKLAAMPNKLLESQPALAQLKQALVDAQVNSAAVLGLRTKDHPLAQAALDAERRVHDRLEQEFAAAIRGLEFDVQLRNERERELTERQAAGRDRLARLAAVRAEYSNLVASVDDHTQLVEDARRSLADARARQAGARSASVISRIDGVEAGVRPDGLGRTTTVAAGGMGGLLVGLGLVFLVANPVPAEETPVADPQVAPQEADVPFGMFRGMSLAEAIRKVERTGIGSLVR